AITGNTITVDAPLVQHIEDQYGGGEVYESDSRLSNYLRNVGIESLRIESTYAGDTDENHGYGAVNFRYAINFWVRQVTSRYFVRNGVQVNRSYYGTIEDSASMDYKSLIQGGRRYAYGLDKGSHVLFQRIYDYDGRHFVSTGHGTPGPNAFVDGWSENAHSQSGPHHRWGMGTLYDNIKDDFGFEARKRTTWQTGVGWRIRHGWAGAQTMFWNCESSGTGLMGYTPHAAMNWSVGFVGTQATGDNAAQSAEPFCIWESHNTPVTPRSLYYTQLRDRRSWNALYNTMIPDQTTGTIWNDLGTWGGDGLFGDDVVAWHSMMTGLRAYLRGVIRNLQMQDHGILSTTWSQVSGPGTATFADPTSLETHVSFSTAGSYELRILVDDGVAPASNTLTIGVVALSGPNPPTNLTTTNVAQGSVGLDWDDVANTNLWGYAVYRSVSSGGPYTHRRDVAASAYTDTTVPQGGAATTYYYVVTAIERSGAQSGFSPEASATPPTDALPPTVPTGLMALAGGSVAILDWNDNPESDLWAYGLYRSTTSGGPYTLVQHVEPSQVTDYTAVLETTYYYAVTAIDAVGNESGFSSQVSATPRTPIHIEAEDYDAEFGTITVPIGSPLESGNEQLGWIGAGDWSEYIVNIMSTGAYYVSIRISSDRPVGNYAGTIDLLSGGSLVGTADVYGQGSYDNYATIHTPVTFAASGIQTVRLDYVVDGYNVNWLQIREAAPDIDPPLPNPAAFAAGPTPAATVISMTAVVGTDVSGPVEYYFEEHSGNPGGSDSGWQMSPHYADTGLTPNTMYSYTVRLRDAVGNAGIASAPVNQTTAPPDTTPPTPDPASFAAPPAAVDSHTISMTALTGTDPSGPVEYDFEETSGNPGGTDSGWQTSTNYVDTGLAPNRLYTYTVRMRDAEGNPGMASAPAAVSTTDPSQMPFGGPALAIPGTIEAEDYDLGGAGFAYHDGDPGNNGGAYRTDDVDLENASEGGFNVGWTADGEWLEYTVDVEPGPYDITARYASDAAGGRLRILLNGEELGLLDTPNTGGWQAWQTAGTNNVSLPGGTNFILRFEIVG
ncbi:MAG: carbohydrate-binding protein, partial [Verrucomicrobiota bacterium]